MDTITRFIFIRRVSNTHTQGSCELPVLLVQSRPRVLQTAGTLVDQSRVWTMYDKAASLYNRLQGEQSVYPRVEYHAHCYHSFFHTQARLL